MRKLLILGAGVALSALLVGCPSSQSHPRVVPNDAQGELQKSADEVDRSEQRTEQQGREQRREERQREKVEEKKKEP